MDEDQIKSAFEDLVARRAGNIARQVPEPAARSRVGIAAAASVVIVLVGVASLIVVAQRTTDTDDTSSPPPAVSSSSPVSSASPVAPPSATDSATSTTDDAPDDTSPVVPYEMPANLVMTTTSGDIVDAAGNVLNAGVETDRPATPSGISVFGDAFFYQVAGDGECDSRAVRFENGITSTVLRDVSSSAVSPDGELVAGTHSCVEQLQNSVQLQDTFRVTSSTAADGAPFLEIDLNEGNDGIPNVGRDTVWNEPGAGAVLADMVDGAFAVNSWILEFEVDEEGNVRLVASRYVASQYSPPGLQWYALDSGPAGHLLVAGRADDGPTEIAEFDDVGIVRGFNVPTGLTVVQMAVDETNNDILYVAVNDSGEYGLYSPEGQLLRADVTGLAFRST